MKLYLLYIPDTLTKMVQTYAINSAGELIAYKAGYIHGTMQEEFNRTLFDVKNDYMVDYIVGYVDGANEAGWMIPSLSKESVAQQVQQKKLSQKKLSQKIKDAVSYCRFRKKSDSAKA